LFTLVMKFHDRQSSERCIRKLISRHCLEKTCTRWNDFLFLITDDCDFRPQTCTNGLVFRECKHIKNIFEDVYFTKNSFHITLNKYLFVAHFLYYLKKIFIAHLLLCRFWLPPFGFLTLLLYYIVSVQILITSLWHPHTLLTVLYCLSVQILITSLGILTLFLLY
jgi:hypothetical protein